MTPTAFLAGLAAEKGYRRQIVHVEHLPPRPARYGKLRHRLHPNLVRALQARGVGKFFLHQAQAIDLAQEGQHIVVATGTASGKTLCYNVPVLQSILTDPEARALYLFPTKALAQDQLRSLDELQRGLPPRTVLFGSYDGDTPRAERTPLRKTANIVLTNPDMLSRGILPNHPLWADLIRNLRYVVIDEAHVYRGVFGSQVACVLRRLWRICRHYRVQPQFIFCSATIANPGEHVERLCGQRVQVINQDGAPRGAKEFALWNPPLIDPALGLRRSPNSEAAYLFASLVRDRMRNITFARARKTAELILSYAREQLKQTDPKLAEQVRSYRAGYLADERREIESGLFSGALRGVTATNALELGIDIGQLDATVLVGFPGTIASLWQQAGRAGRGTRDALTILVGADDPLNQYFMRHPEVLFQQPVEHALIHPDNTYILEKHLPCAAFEVPLTSRDEALFGPGYVRAMANLEEKGVLSYRPNVDKFFFVQQGYPAEQVNLRSVADHTVTLVNQASGLVMEEIEGATAMRRAHEGAIYLSQGETYLVTRLDLAAGVAYCKPVQADYYTETRQRSETRMIQAQKHRRAGSVEAFYGDVRVTEQVVGYRRKRQFSEEIIAEVELDYPPQSFETKALWWEISPELLARLERAGYSPGGSLHAVEHACIGLLPLFAMCDRWDIGGLSILAHQDTQRPQVFIYDGFPGGIGIAEKGYTLVESLWRATRETVEKCACEYGCPSCIISPKCGNNNQPLDKRGAVALLSELLEGN